MEDGPLVRQGCSARAGLCDEQPFVLVDVLIQRLGQCNFSVVALVTRIFFKTSELPFKPGSLKLVVGGALQSFPQIRLGLGHCLPRALGKLRRQPCLQSRKNDGESKHESNELVFGNLLVVRRI